MNRIYTIRMQQTVIGVFTNKIDADATVNQLKDNGYNPKDISILMRQGPLQQENPVAHGAASGVVTGGIIGGVAGLLIGIGAIAIPGIGALLIGGPLAAAFGITGAAATTVSGVATGAVAGGIIGAFTGIGIPEEEARAYEERIKQGAIVVAVSTQDTTVDAVRSIFEDHHAERLRTLTA